MLAPFTKSQLLRYTLLALIHSSLILASPLSFSQTTVHDSRTAAPEGFVELGPVSLTNAITIDIALVPSNIAGLEKQLCAVSTPGSASYGKYLSEEEVASYVKPTAETVSKVNAWLASHSLTGSSKVIGITGDRISVTLPVSKANELLGTTFSTYRHSETGTESIQALSYSIPVGLQDDIDMIEPTTSFPNPSTPGHRSQTIQHSAKRSNADPSCQSQLTPACLQSLYGIPVVNATQFSNQLAIAGFGGDFANRADLKAFLQQYRPDLKPQPSFRAVFLDGGSNNQDPSQAGILAGINLQYTLGLAPNVTTTFYSSGDNTVTGFLDTANYILRQQPIPNVLLTTHGWDERLLNQRAANNLCNMYMRLASQGISVIYSSEDGGVAGKNPDQSCGFEFIPTFPSTCPFVTSVGATTGDPESGATLSSGGFSNYFLRPSYQFSQVSSYMTRLGSQYSGRYNTSGRAYPDVSTQGLSVATVHGGQQQLYEGTGASASIFAAIIALLNDQLIRAGRPALGFLNPFLYRNGGAFTDVMQGNNPGCGTNGFPASSGWDPITGLGTPKFQQLKVAAGL